MAKDRMRVINPEKFEVELTMTKTLEDWNLLAQQLKRENWPSYDVWEAIDDMISQVGKEYYPNQEEEAANVD